MPVCLHASLPVSLRICLFFLQPKSHSLCLCSLSLPAHMPVFMPRSLPVSLRVCLFLLQTKPYSLCLRLPDHMPVCHHASLSLCVSVSFSCKPDRTASVSVVYLCLPAHMPVCLRASPSPSVCRFLLQTKSHSLCFCLPAHMPVYLHASLSLSLCVSVSFANQIAQPLSL